MAIFTDIKKMNNYWKRNIAQEQLIQATSKETVIERSHLKQVCLRLFFLGLTGWEVVISRWPKNKSVANKPDKVMN